MNNFNIEVIFENEDIDIQMTQHGNERSRERYGRKVNIKKEDIEKIVNNAKNNLMQFIPKFSTFVLHGLKSKLNVVGSFFKNGGKYIFKVITVMIKDKFFPRDTDKYLQIQENRIFNFSEYMQFKNIKIIKMDF